MNYLQYCLQYILILLYMAYTAIQWLAWHAAGEPHVKCHLKKL